MTNGNAQILFYWVTIFQSWELLSVVFTSHSLKKDNGLLAFSPKPSKHWGGNKKKQPPKPSRSFQKLHHVHFIQINVWTGSVFIKSSKVTGTQLALGAALQSFHSCDEQMEHVLAHAADTIHNSRSDTSLPLGGSWVLLLIFFFFKIVHLQRRRK